MTVGAIALYGAGILLLVGYARRGEGAFDRGHWSGARPAVVVLATVGLLVAGSLLVYRTVSAGSISPATTVAVVLGVALAAITVRTLWDVLFLAAFQ